MKFNLRRHRHLIIGGHYIEKGRYPYFVSIDKNNGVVVAGALIAKDIVLSAGHVYLDTMGNLTVKVGTYSIHDSPGFAEEIAVEKWLVPNSTTFEWRQFTPGYFANDFMIFKLAGVSSHKPVQLNRNPDVPTSGEIVRIMGLGWTNASYLSPSPIVKQIDMVAMDNADCQNTTDPHRGSYKGLILESMLCTASPPNTTRDACAWDSGAPVIIPGATAEDDLLVGLGSTGVGCADLVFPSIQARVSAGMGWIEQQVCELSVDPPAYFKCNTSARTEPAMMTTNTTQLPAATITQALYSASASSFWLNKYATTGLASATMFVLTFSIALLACVGVNLRYHRRQRRRAASFTKEKRTMFNAQSHQKVYDSIN